MFQISVLLRVSFFFFFPKAEGISGLFALTIGGFSRFLLPHKTPSVLLCSPEEREFVSWGQGKATCEAGLLLQEEAAAA